jgi:cytochrome c oxidase assembly protein subunit 15
VTKACRAQASRLGIVEVETTAAPRLGALAITPRLFRTLAVATVGLLYAIVVTGATVRLTASGLGCEHWPGCSAGNPFPEKDYHAFIEFGNRLVGAVTILVTLATAIASWRAPGVSRSVTTLAGAVFGGTLAQAPLGALTVYLDLHPLLVMAHFLLSIAVLGGAVVVALSTSEVREGPVPREPRRLAVALAASTGVLLVTGTFATAAGPHSGGADIERLGTLSTSVAVHAATVAVFAALLFAVVGYLAARRDRLRGSFRLAGAIAGAVVVQMALGELQYRTHLPWGLVLLHVALAAAVWTGTVALATRLTRAQDA